MMPHERRLSLRKMPEHLAYLSLPFNNGGVVVDISEGGLGFRAIAAVQADGPIHLRFAIDSAARIRAVGELAWADETGKVGGLRFTQLPDEVREQIRAWAGQSSTSAKVRAKASANAKASASDIPNAPPAIEAQVLAAPASKIEFAQVTKTGHPLLYNLKPPIYSAPFYKLSMFPPQLNSEVEAPAMAVQQFVQLAGMIHELILLWTNKAKAHVNAGVRARASARVKARMGPRLKINVGAKSRARAKTTIHEIPAVQPAMEPKVVTACQSDSAPVLATGRPLLYNLKPAVYSAPSNKFSMFPLEASSATDATAIAVPRPVAIKHPIAAVGLTIVLAFLFSIGIFTYISTSPAGEFLFDWGEKMWSGSYSQTMPGDPAPPVRSAPASSKIHRE
jgi:hypothetical protein